MNHGSPHRAPVRSVWIPTFRRIMSHQFLLGYTSKCNTINTELHINHIIQPYIYISFVLFSINHRDSLSLLGKKKQFNCFKPGWFPWAEQNLTFAGATGFCQTKVTYKTMYGHKTRYVGCSETYHVNKQTSLWP